MFCVKTHFKTIIPLICTNLGLIRLTRQRWRWSAVVMWAAFGSATQTDPTHAQVNTDVWLIWLLSWFLGKKRWLRSRGHVFLPLQEKRKQWNYRFFYCCCLWANDLFSRENMIKECLIWKWNRQHHNLCAYLHHRWLCVWWGVLLLRKFCCFALESPKMLLLNICSN